MHISARPGELWQLDEGLAGQSKSRLASVADGYSELLPSGSRFLIFFYSHSIRVLFFNLVIEFILIIILKQAFVLTFIFYFLGNVR